MSRQRSSSSWFLATAILFAVSISIGARWTPESRRCAAAIGVDLGSVTSPPAAGYFKHLTWVSDVIVLGVVRAIEHDPMRAYPTSVRVEVTTAERGAEELPADGTLYVDLFSGPAYDPRTGKIGGQFAGGEISFADGEQVLLFLSGQDSTVPPYGDHVLEPGHYLPVADTKWLVDGDDVWSPDVPKRYRIESIRQEIAFTVDVQSRCAGAAPGKTP